MATQVWNIRDYGEYESGRKRDGITSRQVLQSQRSRVEGTTNLLLACVGQRQEAVRCDCGYAIQAHIGTMKSSVGEVCSLIAGGAGHR